MKERTKAERELVAGGILPSVRMFRPVDRRPNFNYISFARCKQIQMRFPQTGKHSNHIITLTT
jgi:hypothetical protein